MPTSPASSPSSLPLPTLDQIRAERARREAERELQRKSEQAQATRERCTSLVGFVREAWHVLEPNSVYWHGWHIDAICAHLEAITAGHPNRLLINVPPGMMKSLLVSVFWPAWEWGPQGLASLRYLASSYSENYVKRRQPAHARSGSQRLVSGALGRPG